jgi:DNA-binding transcriptional LysR family regulator
MPFEDRHIRFVYEVIDSGGVRAAAERLNLDPSVVSRHIAQAEASVGMPIFERHGRGLKPTAAGKLLFAYYREHLRHQAAAQAGLEDLFGLRSGEVFIVTGEGFVSDLMIDPIRTFRSAHPGILIRIETSAVDSITKSLIDDATDIGVAYNPSANSEVKSWAKRSLPIDLIAAPNHPLIKLNRSLYIRDILPYPIGLLTKGFGLRKAVDVVEFIERMQINPNTVTNSIAALKSFVQSGDGVTFLPRIVVKQECERGEIAVASVLHDVFRNAELHVLTRKKRKLAPASSRMLKHLVNYVKST